LTVIQIVQNFVLL